MQQLILFFISLDLGGYNKLDRFDIIVLSCKGLGNEILQVDIAAFIGFSLFF